MHRNRKTFLDKLFPDAPKPKKETKGEEKKKTPPKMISFTRG